MEKRFRRDLAELPSIFGMAQSFCATNALGSEDGKVLAFMLEELFTNFVKYGSSHDDEILVQLHVAAGCWTLVMTDFNAERFDLRERQEVDIDKPLGEREPGGLGIHLMRQLADHIDYEYDDRRSTVTISRRLH